MTDLPLPDPAPSPTDPEGDGPVDEPVIIEAPTERVRRFRNDSDVTVLWNGHAIVPHQDVEILLPADPIAPLAAGLVETTFTARFPQAVAVEPDVSTAFVNAENAPEDTDVPTTAAEGDANPAGGGLALATSLDAPIEPAPDAVTAADVAPEAVPEPPPVEQ